MSSAIILAGGSNSRIGQNKALLDIKGDKLIEIIVNELDKYFNAIYIVTKNKEEYNFLNNSKLEVIEDYDKEDSNILKAIYTGLDHSKEEDNFITSCDRPYINIELIKYLNSFTDNYQIVCPIFEYQQEFLHSFYSKKCLKIIEERIEKKDKTPKRLFRNFNTKYVQEEEIIKLFGSSKYLFQINTYLDYLLCV